MLLRTCLVLLAASTIAVATPLPATAHAALESATPADEEELAVPPEEVRLEFSEPVALPTGGLRVYDSRGERVDVDDGAEGASPSIVRTRLEDGLPDGTYIVTWRVVSSDGHPVAGASVFHIGSAATLDDSLLVELFASDADRPYTVAATVARWVMYAGVLLAAGAVAFLLWVTDRHDPDRRHLARIGGLAALIGAVAALATVPLQAAETTGYGAEAFVRIDLLGDALTGSVGAQAAMQVVALTAVVVALRRPQARWFPAVAGVGSALALGAFLLAGHTRTVGPAAVMVVADAVHVTAAAVWFGGLVLLAVALHRRRLVDDPVGAAGLVARFSFIATISLISLIAAGVAMSWALVRTLQALVSTAYGWTLLAKIAAAVAVIAVGAYNNRYLVPAIRQASGAFTPQRQLVGGSSDQPPSHESWVVQTEARLAASRAWALLGRTARFEVAGLLAVLAIASVLVYLQPAADAAGVTAPFSTSVELAEDYELDLVVDPNRAGFNEVHLYLLDQTGRPAAAEGVELGLSLPSREIGPVRRTPAPAGPGHWILAGRELSIPGTWQVEVEVDVSTFEQLRQTVPVTVNP